MLICKSLQASHIVKALQTFLMYCQIFLEQHDNSAHLHFIILAVNVPCIAVRNGNLCTFSLGILWHFLFHFLCFKICKHCMCECVVSADCLQDQDLS